jgi:hypothetical protein
MSITKLRCHHLVNVLLFVPATIPPTLQILKKTIPLPSPLQQLLNRFIAVHRHESQQSLLDEKFHVQFGLKRLHCVKTLSLQFIG